MGSTYYRQSDRDRDWDVRSTRSARDEVPRNATVRRYVIKDDDSEDRDRYDTKLKVTTGGGGAERSHSGIRRSTYEADFEEDDRRSYYRSRGPEPERQRDDTFREREIRITRDISPPERERDSPRSPQYDLDRYTRTTEYWREPERSPQPIIIRNEAPQPIIIRERAPERQQIIVRERERSPEPPTPREESVHDTRSEHRTEVASSRALTRREPSPEPEEDYYYERRVRRITRAHSDEGDDRESKHDDRQKESNQSDDEEYYYRKTEEGYSSNDEHGPAHHRHLAEGAIAGLGAAALLRHHRRKSGVEDRGRAAGAGQLAGGAALGALAAQGITKAQAYRSKSRARSAAAENERGGRRRGRGEEEERSRSRSGSGNNKKNLTKLGAIAALGALAGYAASRRNKGAAKDDRRSRSRRRGSSRGRDRSVSSNGSDEGKKGMNSKATIAGAGLASAAVAGLVDRARSKSRGGEARSKGRMAIPVAAAGLGGAALAGLYEANKAKKGNRDRSISASPSRSRSRRRSRRRSSNRGDQSADQGLIEYGSGPATGDRDIRSGSRGDSRDSSPQARLRSRSRGTEGEVEPGSGAYAAHQRRERKRAERAQRQQEEDRNETPLQQPYGGFGPYAQAAPEPPMQQEQFYPNQPYYPPPANNFAQQPPQNPYSPVPNIVNHQQPYNPEDFPQNPPYAPPGVPHPGSYQPGAGPGPYDDPNYHQNVSPFAYKPGRYLPVRNDRSDAPPTEQETARGKSVHFGQGVEDSGLPSMALVRRDTNRGNVSGNDEQQEREVEIRDADHRVEREDADSDERPYKPRRRRKDRGRRHSAGEPPQVPRKLRSTRGEYDEAISHERRKRRTRSESPLSDVSEETIYLPDRFDHRGQRKGERREDLSADKMAEMLQGTGRIGRWLQRFTDSSGSR